METKLYVAYGSNLNTSQMAYRCPSAKIVGSGILNGYQLVFNRVATVKAVEGTQTPVGIWRVNAQDDESLDRYEGFPTFYRKEQIQVTLKNGETLTAMIYLMNSGKPQCPSEYYYNIIKQGYKDFGFDIKTLNSAVKASKTMFKNTEKS